MEDRLDLLGRLMAYVRQMDMLMKDDAISQVLAAVSHGRVDYPEAGKGASGKVS
jgi:hypothetical protein